jgi:predicted transcriptional regulator
MVQATLFLSIKPTFARKILGGTKTIELRRARPNVAPGETALIYSSSPEMALLGSARVVDILSGPPSALWCDVKDEAGVSRQEYDSYFSGAAMAIGIRLEGVQCFVKRISLQEIRERWPWLRPPQSYRYVDALLGPDGRDVASLAPRHTSLVEYGGAC